jgi:calmodulin
MESLASEDLDEIRLVFDTFDDQKRGFLELSVLEKALRCLGLNPSEADMEDIISDLQGKPCNLQSFIYLVFVQSRNFDFEGDAIRAFRAFDQERKGKLPQNTIRAILRKVPDPFSDEQIDRIFAQSAVKEGQLVDYEILVRSLIGR